MARRTAGWQPDHDRWQDRDLSARRPRLHCRHVCIWADGGYLRARSIRVSSGATPGGRTSLRGFQVGSRDSPQRWRELLVGVTARGLAIAAEMAGGDGAVGVWKAVGDGFPGTCRQLPDQRHRGSAEVLRRPRRAPGPPAHVHSVESVFATVRHRAAFRHRTLRPKRALSQKTVTLTVFTLVRAAAKK